MQSLFLMILCFGYNIQSITTFPFSFIRSFYCTLLRYLFPLYNVFGLLCFGLLIALCPCTICNHFLRSYSSTLTTSETSK